MNDIIKQLTSRLGIGADQAEAGAGAVLHLIKENAASGDFQQLTAAVPEASQWIAKAQATLAGGTGGRTGVAGLLGAGAGLLGGTGGGLATVLKLLGQLGIGPDVSAKLVPELLGLLKGRAGDDLVQRLGAAVPGLKDALTGPGIAGSMGKLFG
jgi:hypothetical protein